MWWTRNGSGPGGVELRLADVLDFARGEARARRGTAAHHGDDDDDDVGGSAVGWGRAWRPRAGDPPPAPEAGGRPLRVSAAGDGRPSPGGGPKKPRPALEAGFDRWLDRQLHEIYDPVLDEAIPDEIASLLDRFARKPPPVGGGDADGGGGGGGPGGPEEP
jgi:Anti-sigma factor NepR